MKVYIAGPFFNDSQFETILELESVLLRLNISFFSPRNVGVVQEIKEGVNREEKLSIIYKENIAQLNACDTILCVIDNNDVGTMFELGYFTSLRDSLEPFNRRIITYTEGSYDLNIMLRNGVDCHVKNLIYLEGLLMEIKCVKTSAQIQNEVYEKYDCQQKVVT